MAAHPEPRAWIALGVASASIFLFVLDSGLISVSLPAIAADFPQASRTTLSWIATGYLVALASLLVVGGRVADRLGRKRWYLHGVAVFTIGSVLTALAPNVGLLIAARVVQGVGGAFLTSSALAMVLTEFPVTMRATVVGIWGGIGSVAAVLAPTGGALLVEHVGWRSVFVAVVPIGVATWVVGRRVLRESADPRGRTDIDPAQLVFVTGGLALLALVLSRGGRWGWVSATTLGCAVLAVGALAGFVVRARHDDAPLVDLGLFRYPQFAANTVAAGLQQIGFFAWFITTPLILVNLWGWSVLAAGSAMALGQVASTFAGPYGGRLADRHGTTPVIVLSAFVAAAGPLWLALTATTRPAFVTAFLPATLLIGVGGGMCGILTTGGALHGLPEGVYGGANGTHQMVRRMSSALGVALAVALYGERTGAATLRGARLVWLLVAAAHVAMCAPLVRSWRSSGSSQDRSGETARA